MFSSNKKMSGVSLKLGKFVRIARSKTMLAAAVAATTVGFAGSSYAAFDDITSLTAQLTTGTEASAKNVVGAGATYSVFQAPSTYSVNYGGEDDKVLTVTAGGQTYSATGMASSTVVRRNAGPNNDQLWYDGTGGAGNSTVNLYGPALSGYNQVFDTNNLLVGGDNVFSNEGNAVGNNTNVDRIDMLFTGGIKASAQSAFSVMDRGPTDDHDAFQVAAITSLGSNGAPATYGKLISFADGSYGKTDLAAATEEIILRTNNNINNDPLHPSDFTVQAVGGVLIPTSDLVAAGTTIYGYSLFSPDVTENPNGPDTQLANWTNGNSYHDADSTSTGGGLDPVADLAVLYTQNTAVPEPTSAVLVTLAIGGLLGRRPKRMA